MKTISNTELGERAKEEIRRHYTFLKVLGEIYPYVNVRDKDLFIIEESAEIDKRVWDRL
jgi:hypothetical protein